jgi:hypothetical protein
MWNGQVGSLILLGHFHASSEDGRAVEGTSSAAGSADAFTLLRVLELALSEHAQIFGSIGLEQLAAVLLLEQST